MNRHFHRLASALAFLAIVTLATPSARAWDTAEHVQFGMQIAQPFEEDVFAGRVPVVTASVGASTFGHYVSAPDYGRGLRRFLDEDPSAGSVACGTLWTPAGVIDGVVVNDQASLAEPSLLTQATYLDCLDGWRINNSHFGDFASNHFTYYHALALEAARRYRRTRQDSCQRAAYTLEAWGQHYLTDSTAAGHAWNPAGSYDASFDWQTTNGVTQRMRIHNYLNETGARLAGSLYDLGIVWGDASSAQTTDGLSVPQRIDDPQRALTLRLARMALGQVVSVAECGGAVRESEFYTSRADMNDPRHVYVSDESMCEAMYGEELSTWQPDSVNFVGLDLPLVIGVASACKSGDGVLVSGRDGAVLARHFFQDKYYHAGAEDGFVHPALDANSAITLDSLGCGEDLPTRAPSGPATRDLCDHLVCETTRDTDGACPPGHTALGECCYPPPTFSGRDGVVELTAWEASAALPAVALSSVGVVPGEGGEFLWFRFTVPHLKSTALPFGPVSSAVTTLPGGEDLAGCGDKVSYAVHETRVRMARKDNLRGAVLSLRVSAMDEGLRVEVNDRVVAQLDRVDADSGTVEVPVVLPHMPPTAEGDYVVRLVQLNDCDAARPTKVQWVLTGAAAPDYPPTDAGIAPNASDAANSGADGSPSGSCGCRSGDAPTGAGSPFLVLFVAALLRRRRRA